MAEALAINNTLITLNLQVRLAFQKNLHGNLNSTFKAQSIWSARSKDVGRSIGNKQHIGHVAYKCKCGILQTKHQRFDTNQIKQRNRIGDEGAETIAQGLAINKKLTELHLWVRHPSCGSILSTNLPSQYNEIGCEGIGHIAEALKINNTLTALNLIVRLPFPFKLFFKSYRCNHPGCNI